MRILEKPVLVEGEVIKGFGRGSKELGIPTANFSEHIVENMAGDLDLGVYFGLSQIVYRNFEASTKENIILRASPIYPMVMSIGWNPFYKNSKKSCETHVMHDFGKECFYGETLKIVVLGYIRPEKNYNCLDDLIKDIHNDIDICRKQISCNQTFLALSKDDPKNPFFQSIMQ